MLDQIAAYTAASLLAPASQGGRRRPGGIAQRAKGLWKQFVNDEAQLAHVVTAAGRVVAGTVSGATVRAPRGAALSTTAPLVVVTIRQQTLDDRWHPFRQADLVALTEIGTGATVLLQAPPGFSWQVELPAGRYRVAGVRLGLAGELAEAPLLALAAVTVAPVERLPHGWAAPAQLPRNVHSRPVTVGAPATVDLAFVGAGEHGELPATFGTLLAAHRSRRAA